MQPQTDKFTRSDKVYLTARKELAGKIGFPDLWETIDQLGLFAGVQTMARTLAVYETVKRILHLPGHIAEFGVYKGANLLLLAKLLQILQPNTMKYVYGFDSFEGLQVFSPQDRLEHEMDAVKGLYQGDETLLRRMISFYEMQDWVFLVKGDVLATIPDFARENPHAMFSLVYVDLDIYLPCKAILEFAHERLLPGGIIAFDEALTNSWKGEGQALQEFLMRHPGEYTSEGVAFSRQPTVLLCKK